MRVILAIISSSNSNSNEGLLIDRIQLFFKLELYAAKGENKDNKENNKENTPLPNPIPTPQSPVKSPIKKANINRTSNEKQLTAKRTVTREYSVPNAPGNTKVTCTIYTQ